MHDDLFTSVPLMLGVLADHLSVRVRTDMLMQ